MSPLDKVTVGMKAEKRVIVTPEMTVGHVVPGMPAVYGVRPEHFVLADDGIDAEIQVIEPTGSETQLVARFGGQDVTAVFRERHQFKPGETIRLKHHGADEHQVAALLEAVAA